jgi:hypothetical protein
MAAKINAAAKYRQHADAMAGRSRASTRMARYVEPQTTYTMPSAPTTSSGFPAAEVAAADSDMGLGKVCSCRTLPG